MPKTPVFELDKGGGAEEAIRAYFRDLGSFAIRGVPIIEGRQHVSDIDIWVYTRASVHARHISIVDVKNKKRAKGFERAIWVRGLQSAVGANEAIIASTASSESVAPFARKLGVRVLSKNTISAIEKRYGQNVARFSKDDLHAQWKQVEVKAPDSAKQIVESATSELSKGITFRSLNKWIDDSAVLFVAAFDRERDIGPLWRAAFFLASLVAIGGDYLGRELSFAEPEVRLEWFRTGLLFGNADRDSNRSYLNFAEVLVTEHLDPTGAAAATIRSGFERDLERLPMGGFAEFFSRPAAGKELVDAAMDLENAAFTAAPTKVSDLRHEARAVVGLLVDYAGLPRGRIMTTPNKSEPDSRNLTHQTQQSLPLPPSEKKNLG